MRPREPLAGLESRLRLHPRKRLVLLEELGADLDALEDELASRGLPRGRARAAALDRLYPRDGVVRELEASHAGPYRRWADRLGPGRIALIERLGLALVVAATLLGVFTSLAWAGAYEAGGVFTWIETGLTALLAVNALRVAWRIWVREDMRAFERRIAWRLQLGLVLVAISAGGIAALLELQALVGGLETGTIDTLRALGHVRAILVVSTLAFAAPVFGLFAWQALSPSLASHELIERRIEALFVRGPRLVADRDARERDASGSRAAPGRAGSGWVGPHARGRTAESEVRGKWEMNHRRENER